ncbi:YggS family pyridoxal phosphate-dependent enzyme [Paraoerskovia sediminicola]|uniref:YggS family pyridoxal phosphate-dependent enzyme n=1 Tax=Paraoerskovia sediminicola TaxID=1138587 RepID=UPI002572C4CF|nr:YggS family pyridoxal phosphate-dependent enzyme [Paraoerskovia sediminicola]
MDRVARAARANGRDPAEVRVLVATKTQDLDAVRAAVTAGAGLVGENRVQELVAKAPGLPGVPVHLIGPLQRNKINQVLAHADCVQTVDSDRLAQALSERCVRDGITLDVMVQSNVSGEPTKSGAAPDDVAGFATRVAALPGLHLTGFMTIGARSPDEGVVRAGFARLRGLRDEVVASGAPGTADAHELSMGMSGDLEAAVAEGATIVRVGTAVFGPR